MLNQQHEQKILAKLRALPPERLAEVEDFMDFLRSRGADHALTSAAAKLSEASLAQVWDNADDAEYDRL